MRTGWIAILLLGTFPLLACEPAEETAEDFETAMDTLAEEAAEPFTPASAVHEADMEPKNESGIDGTASFRFVGADSLEVEIELQGVQAGQEYASHIHAGTCDAPGNVVRPLNPVSGDTGTSMTTVALSELAGQQDLLVMSHGQGGQPVACANVPHEALGHEGM